MKIADFIEKRRSKRLGLSLPMKIRLVTGKGRGEAVEGITSNVSYEGAYIRDIDLKNIKPNDSLHVNLSVPRDEARDFPFSRIIGNARVVRAENNAYALEFSEGISRFFVAN